MRITEKTEDLCSLMNILKYWSSFIKNELLQLKAHWSYGCYNELRMHKLGCDDVKLKKSNRLFQTLLSCVGNVHD